MALKYGFNTPLLQKRLELASIVETESSSLQKLLSNHWDTILISVISIFAFVLVLNRKNKKGRTK